MDKKAKEKINQKVYRSYPALKGSRPKLIRQKKKQDSLTYTLIYKSTAITPNNKKIPLIVRVVCTDDGKILKISSAR